MPRRQAFLPKSGAQKIKLNVDSAELPNVKRCILFKIILLKVKRSVYTGK